jgi:hypothetical protein
MEEGLSTIARSADMRQAAIRRQLQHVDLAVKDQDTAFLIELIGGILGFLGVGYIYAGLTNAGLVRLIGYWVVMTLVGVAFSIFAVITFGLGSCLAPVLFIPHVIVAYFSADDLKKSIVSAKSGRDEVEWPEIDA